MREPSYIVWNRLTAGQQTQLLKRPAVKSGRALRVDVAKIIDQVRRGGDRALGRLTKNLDQVNLKSFAVTPAETAKASKQLSRDVKLALRKAAGNIETFHRAQLMAPLAVEVSPGLVCRRISVPLDRAGLYIPGGSASLPSTVLMLGIPAMLARCPARILCSPPRKDGSMDPGIIYAAELCGISSIFKVGGAQAIAAMAYGTKSIPKVDKIFGPGNAWVTEAKLQVAMDAEGAAIDMPAGPSEVMIIGDASSNPDFIAADMLSQAEHGADSQAVFVSMSVPQIGRVRRALQAQIEELPRKAIARKAMSRSLFLKSCNLAEALQIANLYAPEHLILHIESPDASVAKIRNAGSVFLGPWAPESVGDYASGTNHVLPTYGYAKSFSGVGVSSFQKEITFQSLTEAALREIGPTVEVLADLEGLQAHKVAVKMRLDCLRRNPPYQDTRKRAGYD